MPSKKPDAKSTPRDVFLYLLMIVTLYASVIAFVTLAWQFINVQFPDPLQFYYSSSAQLMRNAISALVIVWPVFLLTSWFIKKDLVSDKTRQHTWVRRWLLYLTLFIAAITIIVDLVTLMNSFLGGELTVRFLLKMAVILVVAIGVFWFYLWELRRDASKPTNVHKIAGISDSVAILALIVAGFFVVGTPAQQRDVRLDEQRMYDLQSIQSQVTSFWVENDRLPESMMELAAWPMSYGISVDPLTNAPYEYLVTGELTYELCATFATDSDHAFSNQYVTAPMKGTIDSWAHGKERHCFQREINPEFYAPRQ